MNTHLAPLALSAALSVLASGCATSERALPPSPAAVPSTAAISAPALPAPVSPESPRLEANETQVARYTTVTTQPEESDSNPLAVVAKVHFPRQVVHSVGDAVRYLLLRTGYQLSPDASLDPAVTSVLTLRLPDNQRVLGPYRVDVMLSVLMGRPFRLVADPATRQVRYELLPAAAAHAPTASAVSANR